MRQGELILCKEKIAPLELTKVWTKGGDIKKGVLVIKTAEAMDIVAAMNLQNLALKNTELENHFEKGQSAAVTLMTSAKSGENSQPVYRSQPGSHLVGNITTTNHVHSGRIDRHHAPSF